MGFWLYENLIQCCGTAALMFQPTTLEVTGSVSGSLCVAQSVCLSRTAPWLPIGEQLSDATM